MRIALISDLHANFEALKALSDVLESADRILCAGDLTGYYCQVNEVMDYVRAMGVRSILGNHDYFLLYGCPDDVPASVRFGVEFARQSISDENRRWLSELPLTWSGRLDGRTFLMVHGSPWRTIEDYMYPGSAALDRLSEFDYDVILFGQTHRVVCRTDKKPYLLNPGSVGQSRELKATACAMVIDTSDLTVERIERLYDVNTVLKLASSKGAEDWITKPLV